MHVGYFLDMLCPSSANIMKTAFFAKNVTVEVLDKKIEDCVPCAFYKHNSKKSPSVTYSETKSSLLGIPLFPSLSKADNISVMEGFISWLKNLVPPAHKSQNVFHLIPQWTLIQRFLMSLGLLEILQRTCY